MNFLFGYWEIVGIKLWIILGFYLVCLGFKNPYIAVLFVLLVGWCQFLFIGILLLTFYLLGIKFSRLTWRIWILFWCWAIFHVWKISIWSFSTLNFLWLIWIAVTPPDGFPNHPHSASALIVVFDVMCIH